MSAEDPTRSLLASAREHYLPIYRQRELVLVRGEGSRVWDAAGRDFVDLAAGIAVNALGHADPGLREALVEQAGRLWHTSNIFHSEPPIRLAEELVRAAGFARRVFLCNSGAEANEAAIKLARRYAASRGRDPARRVILTFRGSFHGRTLAAITATAQPKYQEGFEPLPAGFRHVDFNDVDALDAAFGEDVCAVLVEPIQGEGGVLPAAPGFLAHLRRRCDEQGALLMLDEIQCGMGRTGRLFAHAWDGISPDVVTLAKALGGGFPIGAMLVGGPAADALGFGSHGTTFGGNPLAAAVARAVLARIDQPELLGNVEARGLQLVEGLRRLDPAARWFEGVRGRGLMQGAVLRPQFAERAAAVLDAAAGEGVLLLTAGTGVLRFVPALNISEAELAEGLERLGRALHAALD
ncbi:aspartate aminotransferase family protein [Pseudomarimonas salicorniae]|uniref:Acetylornithine aminotransferase n=1 Tax=Pseudomarimonas salicorniae TaxID=2933270 RepID=A0ABT0GGR6_9GAMM|nr:aspartate aminotransferase family protein [Lysobacter sp. CAU 1642]MCK7593262.1 aspartate aminotransferase family protein [Lysobacter sp. CAU 1642]